MTHSTFFLRLQRSGHIRALLVFGVLLFTGLHAGAQQVAGSGSNPYAQIGQKIGVAAYPVGTYDRDAAMTKIDLILAGMKGIFSNGGGTQSQKLKYDYCNAVYSDMAARYIAPEITLLTSLSGLNERKNTPAIPNSQLAALYNEITAQLQ